MKRLLSLVLLFIMAIGLSGCIDKEGYTDQLESQDTRIVALETELLEQEAQIEELRDREVLDNATIVTLATRIDELESNVVELDLRFLDHYTEDEIDSLFDELVDSLFTNATMDPTAPVIHWGEPSYYDGTTCSDVGVVPPTCIVNVISSRTVFNDDGTTETYILYQITAKDLDGNVTIEQREYKN